MLTIRAARNPSYYEQREFARDDYYREDGQAPGEWLGRGATELKLSGAPAEGSLETLLSGRHPESGEPLTTGRGRRPSNAGFDLTLTAPKSVSVLLAVGDQTVREAVLSSQRAGVLAALDYLERHECHVRRGVNGATSLTGQGFVAAAYVHEMARSGDPHLHTHLVIANRAKGSDGRWSAPDMRSVYAAAKTAGTLAEAAMRHQLTDRLGLEWGEVRNGTAELAGIPETVLRHFSSRHAEIAELAAARGWTSRPAIEAIQRETRDRKPVLDRELAQRDWQARAAEQGLGRDELAALLGRQRTRDPEESERARLERLDQHLAGPQGLTRTASAFEWRAVIRAYCEAHPQGLAPDRAEQLADGFLDRHALALEPRRGSLPAAFTTRELLNIEARLIALAAGEAPSPAPATQAVEAAIAACPGIGTDQADALRHLASAGPGLVRLLEAPAGSGKTYTLAALREAYQAAGIPVIGTAWQGQAAQNLEREAAIPSETAARLLRRLEAGQPEALPYGALLVVDEAAMMPTRPLERLAAHVAGRDGRLVAVGDRAQLPPIDAGGAFGGLVDRLGAAALDANRRQRTELQRQIAAHLGAGEPARAIALLADSGRLEAFADAQEARAALIAAWTDAGGPASPASHLILAHDRRDVAALNALARAQMERQGRLGSQRISADGREWAPGDRLVCRRNDYRPAVGVRNGTRGRVEAVDPDIGSLQLRTDYGRRIALPADYLPHVRHGYAITAHTSQGETVDQTYLLASPERGGREWAYVAGSRHRIDLELFVAYYEPDKTAEALAEAWARSQAKHLALDRLAPEHASERERASARARAGVGQGPAGPAARLESEAPPESTTPQLLGALAEIASQRRSGGPWDPRAEIARLQAHAAGLAERQRELRGVVARAAGDQARLGPLSLLRRQGRAEAARLREAIRSAEQEASGLHEACADVAVNIAGLRRQLPEREQWERGPGAELDLATEQITGQIADRIERRTNRALAHPPAYLTEVIGPQPAKERQAGRWEAAVRAVEAYRERQGITDPTDALGPQPRQLSARERSAWQEARQALEQARPGREQPAEQDRQTRPRFDPERGLDLDPGPRPGWLREPGL